MAFEFAAGPLMIVFLAVLFRVFLKQRVVAAARRTGTAEARPQGRAPEATSRTSLDSCRRACRHSLENEERNVVGQGAAVRLLEGRDERLQGSAVDRPCAAIHEPCP